MTRAKRAGELLYMDVVGPISSIGHNKARFIVHDINNAFRMHFGECTKEKGEVSRTLHAWAAYLKNRTRHSIQYIHLNNSKEYVKLGTWALKKDISIKPTILYSPEMNGLVEVSSKMIITKARFILIDTGLSKELWPKTVNTVIYLLNQLPTRGLNGEMLIEALNRSLSLEQDWDFCLNLSHL